MIQVTDIRLPYQAHVFVQHVLSTGQLASGDYVDSVEKLAAMASNTTHAVAVNSGTAALQLAVETTVDPGARVAVPALTFAGTANAVYAAGCVPVVVDVGEDRLLDYSRVPDDVDAVMPVHLYGEKALRHDTLPTIEDAAQAIGHHITHGGISLYGSKTAGVGEGGVFVTNDENAAHYARVVRNQGMESRYDHVMVGHNLRLSNLAAAVAVPQLVNLSSTIRQRQANAGRLWELLHDLPIGLPNPVNHMFHQFVITTDNRDDVQEFLKMRGVESAVHYPVALSQLDWLESGECPNAEKFADSVLSIPVHEHLTENEVEYVGAKLREAVEACVSV